MTPEALEQLVKDGPDEKLVEALAPLSETERKALSKTGQRLRRQTKDGTSDRDRACLAIFGVASLSAAKRVTLWELGRYAEARPLLVKVLTDRKPDWCDAWVDSVLDTEWPDVLWDELHELVQNGTCTKPTHDGYARLFANQFNSWNNLAAETHVPLSEKLSANPVFLEDEVWRLFRVENHAFTHDWSNYPEHRKKGYETWSEALLKLEASGKLERQRLLDSSLSALWITTNSNVLGGYRRLHEALTPTPEEIAAREAEYRKLLSHRTPHVVGSALKLLSRAAKAHELDGALLVEALHPVLDLRQKSHAAAALRLAGVLLKKDPSLRDLVLEVAADGLRHTSSDVQERALRMLEAEDELPEGLRAQLRDGVDEVSATLRQRLSSLVVDESERDAGKDCAEDASIADMRGPAVAATSTILANAEALPSDVGVHAGLEGITAQQVEATFPPPIAGFDASSPVGEKVEPIDSLEALIDTAAHAVERVDSAFDVERIVDGISRLCGERPSDFAGTTAPILHRLEHAAGEGSEGLGAWGTPRALADLVATWISGRLYQTPAYEHSQDTGPMRFVEKRLRELIPRVLEQRGAPLLATPTHAPGWVDPHVLVQRARRLQAADLLSTDLLQALLRLAPWERDEALREARGLPPALGRPIRWALGADEGPQRKDRKSAPVWVAAAKARSANRNLESDLAPLGLSEPKADVLVPVRYSWNPSSITRTVGESRYRNFKLGLHREPTLPSESPPDEPGLWNKLKHAVAGDAGVTAGGLADYPTALFHDAPGKWWSSIGIQTAWLIDWTAMIWPAHLEGFFARGVETMVLRIDMEGSKLEPQYPYLHPLFDVYRPWTEAGVWTLWVALVSRDADLRRLAIDALIFGVAEGSVSTDVLSEVFVKLGKSESLKLNRAADSLGEVARVDDLHRGVVTHILERYVASLSGLPRGSHHILELLHESLTVLGGPLHPGAAQVLRGVKGSGKTAKLAKQLVAFEGMGPRGGRALAHQRAWEARLGWAQRVALGSS